MKIKFGEAFIESEGEEFLPFVSEFLGGLTEIEDDNEYTRTFTVDKMPGEGEICLSIVAMGEIRPKKDLPEPPYFPPSAVICSTPYKGEYVIYYDKVLL
jgi:hypothetical protein